MRHDILLLDPPWNYRDNKGNDPALGGKQYAMMTDQELADIAFADIAKKDSLMFCWMVMPKLQEGLSLMKHWGFTPITCGFVWVKLNKSSRGTVDVEWHGSVVHPWNKADGLFLDSGTYSGLGSYTCGNVELCYIGKRGKGVPRQDKAVKQLVFAPLGRHSAKPIEVHKRIDRLYAPKYSRVEFFARDQPYAPHWNATGLEYDGVDINDFITNNL